MKILTTSAVIGTALLLSGPAVCSSDEAYLRADHKIRGHEVQSYQQHAQNRAQALYHHYQQPQPQISRQEAKEIVGGIRQDLTASDKALAKLKSAHAKEPDVVKQIELIEKHHARAHEVCGMAEAECTKEHGDHGVCAECCSQMWHELDAAKAEMDKLAKMLKIEKLPPPKKVDTKKDAKK
jgi:hypothetical protein